MALYMEPGADSVRSEEISEQIEALIEDYLGRVPRSVRTEIGNHTVVCLFWDSMTAGERALAASDGRGDAVRRARPMLQDALREPASAVIERALGRRVTTMLTDHDHTTDLGTLVFVLDSDLPIGEPSHDGTGP